MPSQIQDLSNPVYASEVSRQLDQEVKKRERDISLELDNEIILDDKEKYEIVELVQEMMPLYERIDDILPIFLQLCQNKAATMRIIAMKYMFQDQIKLLDQNKFIFTLKNLQMLQGQFIGCFVYVKNAVDKKLKEEFDNKVKYC